jgi:hydrogenase large subunit
LGVKVTTNASGIITEANAHGNLWRGFENFLVGRRANDAITFTQRICGVCPVPHGSAATLAADSVMGVSGGYATWDNSVAPAHGEGPGIPAAGLLVRNLVLAAEFLMSSITHFYHLAAQSYVQGPAIPPWTPYFGTTQYHPALLNHRPSGGSDRAIPTVVAGVPQDLWSAVIKQYVKALRIRRLTFEASAMFAGRAPMMSMSIAGGTTNMFRSTTEFQAKCDAFRNLMVEVGEFVFREYVPLAFALGALYPEFDSQGAGVINTVRGTGFGAGVGNFLAWGGFPTTGSVGTLKIQGGWKLKGSATITPLLQDRSTLQAAKTLVHANLTEHITRSRYADSLGEFDASGKAYPGDVTRTEPKRTDANKYSWLKAPRWNGQPMEVGPFARVVVNGEYLVDGSTHLIQYPTGGLLSNATDWPKKYGYYLLNSAGTGLDTTIIHPDLVAGLTASGNPTDYTTGHGELLTAVWNHLSTLTGGLSTMDRLRGRAIESLHVVTWILGLPAKTGTSAHGITFDGSINGSGWIGELKALGTSTLPAFSTPVLTPPSGVVSGYGMVEAPRGALAHFITADNGKIKSYQCVVPTTWNASPKDGADAGVNAGNTGTTKRGPMEQSMMGVMFDTGSHVTVTGAPGGASRMSGVEVLRVAQSFDPCIACAVH